MDVLRATGLDVIASIVGTIASALILGLAAWMTKLYFRFRGIEAHLATIAGEAPKVRARIKRQRRVLRQHDDTIDDHEGRITDLEHDPEE